MLEAIYRSFIGYANYLGWDNLIKAVAHLVSPDSEGVALGISIAGFCYVIAILIKALRWRIILKWSGVDYPYSRSVESWFLGELVGILLPASLGVDLYRLYDSTKYSKDFIRSVTVLIIEKILHFVAVAIFTIIFLPLFLSIAKFYKITLLLWILFLFAFACMLFSLFIDPILFQIIFPFQGKKRASRLLLRFKTELCSLTGDYTKLVKLLILGLLIQMLISMSYFWVGVSVVGYANWESLLKRSPFLTVYRLLEIAIIKPGIGDLRITTFLSDATNVENFNALIWFVIKALPFLLGTLFLLREFLGVTFRSKIKYKCKFEDLEDKKCNSLVYGEEVKRVYIRNLLMSVLGASSSGGVIGLGEFLWANYFTLKVDPNQVLFWIFTYTFITTLLGVMCSVTILNWQVRLFRKLFSPYFNYSVSFFFSLSTVGMIVILWRYLNDILGEKPPTYFAYFPIAMGYMSAILVGTAWIYLISNALARLSRKVAISFILVLFLLPWSVGFTMFISRSLDGTVKIVKDKQTEVSSRLKENNNIIFIVADTLRADSLPFYNSNISLHIPNLERLCEEGILFLNCESQASWTKPSFGTMLTGLLPSQHGGVNRHTALNPHTITIAEKLREKGYFTKAFTNNPHLRSIFGFSRGFDEYFEYIPYKQKFTLSETLMLVWHYLQLGRIFGIDIQIRAYYLPAKDITEKVVWWIKAGRPQDKPFFLLIHYMDPHYPYGNREKGELLIHTSNEIPSFLAPVMQESYLKEIEYMDKFLGLLLKELEKENLLEDSYIIFTSDHGEEFNDHGGWLHGETLYEEMLHVPLIIRPPNSRSNTESRGIVVRSLVRLIDLPPTILEITGTEIPEMFEGKPLLSYDCKLTIHNDNYSLAENEFRNKRMKAIRVGNYKLILAEEDYPRSVSPEEMYDLGKDPYEKNNLVNDPAYETVKNQLFEKISQFFPQTEKSIESEQSQVEIPQEIKDQLKALGYLD